jgi:hypothetical protein
VTDTSKWIKGNVKMYNLKYIVIVVEKKSVSEFRERSVHNMWKGKLLRESRLH